MPYILRRMEKKESPQATDTIPFSLGDEVEGIVVATAPSKVFIDLSPFGTGIVYGQEFIATKDVLRKTKIGDAVSAKIISLENEDGYIDLSLKEARRAQLWKDAKVGMDNNVVYTIRVLKANRGGLLVEWNGLNGFLPASHLTEKNYPKVLNGDKDAIISGLKKLIGEKLPARILTVEPDEEKLIFSEAKNEPDKNGKETTETTEESGVYTPQRKIGDICTGIVTGVVDFGVFVKLDSKIEGLIHISEIDWGLVDNPHSFFKVGDSVTVKIIDTRDDKYSCSVKALKENPWETADTRYKIGDVVPGVVIQYHKHGVFISIEAGICGLAHISNFKDEDDMRASMQIGKSYNLKITNFDPKGRKIIFEPVGN